MKNLEKLLVIEDNPEHLERAKEYFDNVEMMETDYVSTYADATRALKSLKDNPEFDEELLRRYDDDDFKTPEELEASFSVLNNYGRDELNDESIIKQIKKNYPDFVKMLNDNEISRYKKLSQQIKEEGIPAKIPEYDGVITDMFFPKNDMDDDVRENGLRVVADCLGKKIPFVVCTSEDHHSTKMDWPRDMYNSLTGITNTDFINRPSMITKTDDCGNKKWSDAYNELRNAMQDNKYNY
ncbi:MAG: hypothetical protein ACQER9_02575 [Nanobdellota archaeon]